MAFVVLACGQARDKDFDAGKRDNDAVVVRLGAAVVVGVESRR